MISPDPNGLPWRALSSGFAGEVQSARRCLRDGGIRPGHRVRRDVAAAARGVAGVVEVFWGQTVDPAGGVGQDGDAFGLSAAFQGVSQDTGKIGNGMILDR